MTANCQRQENSSNECPCTYAGCPRHGNCCQCVAYHRDKGQITACYFTPEEERTYDRSLAFFIKCRTQNA